MRLGDIGDQGGLHRGLIDAELCGNGTGARDEDEQDGVKEMREDSGHGCW